VVHGTNTVANSGNAPKAYPASGWGGLDVTRPGIKQEIPVRSPTYNVGATQLLSVRIRHRNSATAQLVLGHANHRMARFLAT
jgi:hypothetical protein